jgi:sugar phosphate isomerase/epimerase
VNIGIVTDCLGELSFEEVLRTCKDLGVDHIELGCGNWSSAPHVDLDGLLTNAGKRKEMKNLLTEYGITISAFNCSGNQLAPGAWGEGHKEVVLKTFKLSEYFGLDKVVMMSGLPGGGPNDEYPNWVVTSWPPSTLKMIDYQWNKVALPYWKEAVKIARAHGIKKLALEPHGSQLVYNVSTFKRLRSETDETIGFNLDPSHLLWMGADPIRIIRELKDAIYYVHVKDVRIENAAVDLDTRLDTRGVLELDKRSWNFSAPGYGHDERWWREFLVNLKMIGYEWILSIENEDYSMKPLEALRKTVQLLKNNMV